METTSKVLQELDRAKHRAYGDYLETQAAFETFAAQVIRQSADELIASQAVEFAAMDVSIRIERSASESTLAMARLISALSEQEQIDLVRAPDAVYDEYLKGNLSLLDDLELRTDAYRYILMPSAAVFAAHARHIELLARFEVAHGEAS